MLRKKRMNVVMSNTFGFMGQRLCFSKKIRLVIPNYEYIKENIFKTRSARRRIFYSIQKILGFHKI
jgi:hypothetical protein